MTDDDAVEEAEAALSSADSEFGRTTDPVRMYMREMGQVDLLTREDEIIIAKKNRKCTEKTMVQAISACPGSIAEILALIEQVRNDEIRVDEVVEAIIDPNEVLLNELGLGHLENAKPDNEEGETDSDDEDGDDEDEDGSGSDSEAISAAHLAELKQKFWNTSPLSSEYGKMIKQLEKHGSQHANYLKHRDAIANKLLEVRFATRQIENLSSNLRSRVENIRKLEREIRDICIDRVRMERDYFIKNFLPAITDLKWVEEEVAKGRVWANALDRFRHAILEKTNRAGKYGSRNPHFHRRVERNQQKHGVERKKKPQQPNRK